MYQRRIGSYDEIPEGMKRYINNYGCHFNKKLCDWATSQMYKKVDGKKQYIQPYTKEKVEQLLATSGIVLENNKLYDHVYVANMCVADYLGKSVSDERRMAMFIKDTIDDADADEGFIFNRWYADTVFMNNPVEWDDMI